jgi:type II secretory pathway pseudopilin PulG
MVRKLLFGGERFMSTPPRRFAAALGRRAEAAFTLTDVLITSGILLLVGATAIYALTLTNKNAVSSRVQAAAQSVVQNQIDQILTRGPYVPTNVPPDIPTVLTSGTTVTKDVPVFVDPETGTLVVSGTLTTKIEDTGANVKGVPLYVVKAAVTLDYTLGGRAQSVTMNTLRAPDQ